MTGGMTEEMQIVIVQVAIGIGGTTTIGEEIGQGALEEIVTMIKTIEITTLDVMVGDQITIEKTAVMVTREGPHINLAGMTKRIENAAATAFISMRSGVRLILDLYWCL